jgi:spore coat protein U domain-containing protein, fimbrial subunit CupE1/2/3/6
MRFRALLIPVVLAAVAASARAGSVTATLGVSADVVENCRVSTRDLSFGVYDPLGSNAGSDLDASTSLTVVCTKGASVRVVLGTGEAQRGHVRQLSGAGQFLDYQLYRDSVRTQVWSTGDLAVQIPSAGGAHAPNILTIYGRIPAGQNILAGTFTDRVTASVEF